VPGPLKSFRNRLAIATLLTAPLLAQTLTHPDVERATELLHNQQRWQTQCLPTDCTLSVDILRGGYGSAPDPNDITQYISVALAVDRFSQKLNSLTFKVDPHADKNAGLVIMLARTLPEDSGWKVELEPSTIALPIDQCDDRTCNATLAGGLTKNGIDLLAKMQKDTQLFLVYTRAGESYPTTVNLNFFNQAYQQMLAKDLKAAPPISANQAPAPATSR